MDVRKALKQYNGKTIEKSITAIIYKGIFYYVNSIDFDTEEIFCFDGANEDEGTLFYTFTFDELEKDKNLQLFALKKI